MQINQFLCLFLDQIRATLNPIQFNLNLQLYLNQMCKQQPKEGQNQNKNQSYQENKDNHYPKELIPNQNENQLEQISQSSNCSIPRKINKKISKTSRNSSNLESEMDSKKSPKMSNKSCLSYPKIQKADICSQKDGKKCLTLEQFRRNKKQQIRKMLGYHKRVQQMCNSIDKRIILTSDDPIITLMRQDLKIPELVQYPMFQQQQQGFSALQLDIQNDSPVVQNNSPPNSSLRNLALEEQNSSIKEGSDEKGFQEINDEQLDEYQLCFKSLVYSEEVMSNDLLRDFINKKKLLKADEPFLQKIQAQLYNQYYHGYPQNQCQCPSASQKPKAQRTIQNVQNLALRQTGVDIDVDGDDDDDDKSSQSEKNKKKIESHICYHCWEIFENGFKLGGHTSKKHSGKSVQYENKARLQNKNYIDKLRRQYFQKVRPSKHKKWLTSDDTKASSNSEQKEQGSLNNSQNDSESENRCMQKFKLIKKKAPTILLEKRKSIKRKDNINSVNERKFEMNNLRNIDLCELGQNFASELQKPLWLQSSQKQRRIIQSKMSQELVNELSMEAEQIEKELLMQADLMEKQPPMHRDLIDLMKDQILERPIDYEAIYNGRKEIEFDFFT